MFNTFGKLLCAAVLASTALAQSVTIASPPAGAQVNAAESVVVMLEETPPTDSLEQVVLVIGFISCYGGCGSPSEDLGSILYSGSYNPTSTSGVKNPYENITVTIPGYLDGDAQLTLAHFYLSGAYSTPVLEFASTPIYVSGASG